MKLLPLHLLLLVLLLPLSAGAVEKFSTGTYNTSAPTSSDIANWTTGWGTTGITGWDYVGQVNGLSAVYLGNNWVLTADHVGVGAFTLGGITYAVVAGSAHGILDTSGSSADLTLFQIVTAPNLPALTLSSTAPTAFSQSHSGSQVVMIGYGGWQGETWGYNTVTRINQGVTLTGYPYLTTDFETAYGTTTVGIGQGGNTVSVTNNYGLVVGDSGGGDFLFNSSTGTWNLTGINEAVDGSNNSYMVQLGTYATQINTITAVPEPSSYGLFGIGLAALASLRQFQSRTARSRAL